MERIEKLLHELEYEIVRGLLENDLGPEYLFGYSFIHPSPKSDHIVLSRFSMRELTWLDYQLYQPVEGSTLLNLSKPKET